MSGVTPGGAFTPWRGPGADGTVPWWRGAWQGPRLSDFAIKALSGRELASAAAARAARVIPPAPGILQQLELVLLTTNTPWHRPLPAGIELAGRGYQRPPVGPVEQFGDDPASTQNVLQVLWPQAPVPWGSAIFLAVMQIGVDIVLGTVPIATPPFAVTTGDQPRIPARALTFGGVPENTPRPFGVGRYSESVFGRYPPGGDLFWMLLDSIGYSWDQQDSACAQWTAIPLVSGGCA